MSTTVVEPTASAAGAMSVSPFRGPLAIAMYTWREGMRKKTLIGFLMLSMLVIFGSMFMTALMGDFGATDEVDSDVQGKIIKDICVSTISIFGILITIFISASVVPAEMENKVIYTVLSKPVRRFQYLAGKFLGVQMIVLINLVLMSALFFFALYFRGGVWPTLLLWSTLLTYFQFLIVSSFTFAVSCTSTSSVLPTIAGLFIYITGNLTEYLKDVAARAGEAEGALDVFVGRLAMVMYQILPNLRVFDLKDHILYLNPNDPPAEVQIPNLIAYGLLFSALGYLLAYWLFRRKEL
ncbi:MAG: ABC transporter permease subunit [Candidatus Hydrogenedentota bacterium]